MLARVLPADGGHGEAGGRLGRKEIFFFGILFCGNLTSSSLTVTVNMSVQAPPLTSVVRPEATVVKHSKSSLRKQTSGRKLFFKKKFLGMTDVYFTA